MRGEIYIIYQMLFPAEGGIPCCIVNCFFDLKSGFDGYFGWGFFFKKKDYHRQSMMGENDDYLNSCYCLLRLWYLLTINLKYIGNSNH
jgi:hypothetical protein